MKAVGSWTELFVQNMAGDLLRSEQKRRKSIIIINKGWVMNKAFSINDIQAQTHSYFSTISQSKQTRRWFAVKHNGGFVKDLAACTGTVSKLEINKRGGKNLIPCNEFKKIQPSTCATEKLRSKTQTNITQTKQLNNKQIQENSGQQSKQINRNEWKINKQTDHK